MALYFHGMIEADLGTLGLWGLGNTTSLLPITPTAEQLIEQISPSARLIR